MKRRGVLQMLGAVIAAPATVLSAPAMPANIGALAAAHARKYPFISAIGLSNRLGLCLPQAQTVLAELSRQGLVGPLTTCATGPVHAASRVFTPCRDSLIRAAQSRAVRGPERPRSFGAGRDAVRRFSVDLSRFLAHLRALHSDYNARPPAAACLIGHVDSASDTN